MKSYPDLSIIVPVYNVEQYLKECLDSILNQSFKNYELILVNDGSSDSSPAICDQYAGSDNRISVIHKTNGGLSDARNSGLRKATGKYILFVDSDDFLIDNSRLELLMSETLYCSFDFINFNCCDYYHSVNRYRAWKPYAETITQSSNKDIIIRELVKSGTFPMGAWLKLIRRDFLIKNNLFFIKGIISEDVPWFLRLLEKAGSFRFVNLYVYAYRKGVPGSISGSFSKKKFDDLFSILKMETENILEAGWNKDTKDALLSFMAYEYCILCGLARFPYGKKMEKELRQYDWLMKYRLNPKVRMVAIMRSFLGWHLSGYLLNRYLISLHS